jgi:hypothetical protein
MAPALPVFAGQARSHTHSRTAVADFSYALFKYHLQNPPPRNILQKAIILPAQTFNFFESYTDATSMYARTTFLTTTILLMVALGISPA